MSLVLLRKNRFLEMPFTLLRVESVDDSGQSLFRPMWLIVMGERRGELSAVQAY